MDSKEKKNVLLKPECQEIMSTMCVGIDREFERLLEEIFGAEFISLFKARRPAGWVDLMIAFESRKRAADPNKDQPLNVSLPFSLIDFHKKHFVSRYDTLRNVRSRLCVALA